MTSGRGPHYPCVAWVLSLTARNSNLTAKRPVMPKKKKKKKKKKNPGGKPGP
eukprot:NODE_11112_length_1307_cov_3.831356.p10 GENE.NODE_11112_length_1307_cov_3.831356~~NODE_11112_length_1307_cov_3.831356.p10  ORF type:complete len:52 (-),score=18.84 NODE_11112_length_1307_cov_3.831356:153-308(-)